MNPNASYHDTKEIPAMIEPNKFQFAILVGLNRLGKHVYGGTVPEAVKAKRRKVNKAARRARRA
ncbi:hypothetical protein SEA_VROOMVROOM_56 [Arthrobacter phage VroomVroom]|uniref:Uncharacterized protein n=1 Tax=Arthrobacter phage VroomVroom TaxID=3049371 RepID=A0AA49FAG2_9CAUD|nr:hypothetical protein SEA_VROOMVROOM_56 [Arthrobacter phage VroomVroom]